MADAVSAAPAATPLNLPGDSARPTSLRRWQLPALLGVIAVFQFATIRAGHTWGDDFALYILHARALLEGRPYADTGWIYLPGNPLYSPVAYPPGFPFLILPVYALFGLNLVAMKALVCAFFIAALALFASVFRPLLPRPALLGAVALLGFQPYLADFKNQVLPDLPFMFAILLALLVFERVLARAPAGWKAIAWGVLAGLVIYLPVSLRAVGVAIYPALALVLLARRKFPVLLIAGALAAGAILWAWESTLTPPVAHYATQLTDASANNHQSLAQFIAPRLNRVRELARSTRELWGGVPYAVNTAITFLVLALAALGVISRLRRLSSLETFPVCYAGLLLLFPTALTMRYLVPAVPFLVAYALVGALLLRRRYGRPATAAGLGLLAALAVSYGSSLATAEYGRITIGAQGRDALSLYAAVDACARPDDQVMFYKARALTLFTGRRGVAATGERVPSLPAYLRQYGVPWVAARIGDRHDLLARDPASGLRPVFANPTFVLYRNVALPAPPPVPPACAALAAPA